MKNNPENSFKTRRMTVRDVPAVLELQTELKLGPWSETDYREELGTFNSVCLVAESQTEIVGFLIARPIMQEGYLELYNIGVKTEFQGNNLGQELFNCLLKAPIINNLTRILLEVRESNSRAIGFYKKNKFKIINTRKNFYSNPLENALSMEKVLS